MIANSLPTMTSRELRNKDTGIDVSVPNYKEMKGMLGSTYEYHVMVVSNLSLFKTAKHKEKDNVQFVVPKKFADFEELFTKMNTKYCGTAFPPLPKKVLLMNDSVAKERRSGLDYLMKFLSMTPKLCTSPLLLEFLGVSPLKAGMMRNIEVSDKIVAEQDKTDKTENQDELETEKEEPDVSENLFDEEEESDDDSDMFAGISSSKDDDAEVDTKIFDVQELGGAIEEGDENDLFMADAKPNNTPTQEQMVEEEDNTDLFQIDDDLDSIMTLDLKAKHVADKEQSDTSDSAAILTESAQPKPSEKPSVVPQSNSPIIISKTEAPETKTEIDFDDIVAKSEKVENVQRPKPAPRKKVINRDRPAVPKRPEISKEKPDVPKRPEISKEKPDVPKRPEITKEKPNVPKRPDVKTKPAIPKRPETGVKAVTDKEESVISKTVENINEDDILKYIQDNTATEDVDLFS